MAHLQRIYIKTNLIDLQREIDAGNITELELFGTSGSTGLLVETSITIKTTDEVWGICSTFSGQEREGDFDALATVTAKFTTLNIAYSEFTQLPNNYLNGNFYVEVTEMPWQYSALPSIYIELSGPEWPEEQTV